MALESVLEAKSGAADWLELWDRMDQEILEAKMARSVSPPSCSEAAPASPGSCSAMSPGTCSNVATGGSSPGDAEDNLDAGDAPDTASRDKAAEPDEEAPFFMQDDDYDPYPMGAYMGFYRDEDDLDQTEPAVASGEANDVEEEPLWRGIPKQRTRQCSSGAAPDSAPAKAPVEPTLQRGVIWQYEWRPWGQHLELHLVAEELFDIISSLWSRYRLPFVVGLTRCLDFRWSNLNYGYKRRGATNIVALWRSGCTSSVRYMEKNLIGQSRAHFGSHCGNIRNGGEGISNAGGSAIIVYVCFGECFRPVQEDDILKPWLFPRKKRQRRC